MWTLLVSAALAQGQPTIVDGTPEFQSCLTSSQCADNFYRFLGLSMAEQGFTFQNDPQLLSPTLSRREGWTIGGLLTTFPLAPPRANLSGKEENTSYSPVLPRLFGGWKGEVGSGVAGVGGFFLPPIPVQGASSLVLGAHASTAWTLAGRVRVGPEVGFTYTLANAPVVATQEQFEDRENWNYPDNIDPDTYEEVCGVEEDGCVDRFTVANTTVAAAASVDLAAGFSLQGKVGLALLHETLWVMYDDTTWRLSGAQFIWNGGVSWSHEHVQLGAGASFGTRGAALSEEEKAGVVFKLQAGAAARF